MRQVVAGDDVKAERVRLLDDRQQIDRAIESIKTIKTVTPVSFSMFFMLFMAIHNKRSMAIL